MSNAKQLEVPDDNDEQPDDEVVELPPPDLKNARFGVLGELWKLRKQHKKRQKLLKDGYLQWYLVDDSYPQPRFVKPEYEGGTIRELKHNGDRYLFPREAMLPSEQQGMWTVVHKVGEADPINMRDPSRHAIPTDALQEYLTMRPASSPPSFFDKLDLEADDLMKYAVCAFIGLALLNAVGGFI